MKYVTVRDMETIRQFYYHFKEFMPNDLDLAINEAIASDFSIPSVKAVRSILFREILSGKSMFDGFMFDSVKAEARKFMSNNNE